MRGDAPSRPIYRTTRGTSSVARYDLSRASSCVAASSLTSSQRLVLILGYALVADHEGRCWPSPATVAAATGLSVRTVKTTIAELAAAGVLVRTDGIERPVSQRRTAAYTICLDALPSASAGTGEHPTVQPLHPTETPAVQPLHPNEVPPDDLNGAMAAPQPNDGTPIFESCGAMAAPNRSIGEDLQREEILERSRARANDSSQPELYETHEPPPPAPPERLTPLEAAVRDVWVIFCRITDEFHRRRYSERPIPTDVRKKLMGRMEATRTAAGNWPDAIRQVEDMIGAMHFSPECEFYQGKKDGKTYLGPSTLFKNDKWTDRLDVGARWAAAGRPRAEGPRTDPAAVARAEKAWTWIESVHPMHATRPDDVISSWRDRRAATAFTSALNEIGGWTSWGQIPAHRRAAAKATFIAAFCAAYSGAAHE